LHSHSAKLGAALVVEVKASEAALAQGPTESNVDSFARAEQKQTKTKMKCTSLN
jgi:hypothetical protein